MHSNVLFFSLRCNASTSIIVYNLEDTCLNCLLTFELFEQRSNRTRCQKQIHVVFAKHTQIYLDLRSFWNWNQRSKYLRYVPIPQGTNMFLTVYFSIGIKPYSKCLIRLAKLPRLTAPKTPMTRVVIDFCSLFSFTPLRSACVFFPDAASLEQSTLLFYYARIWYVDSRCLCHLI